MSDLRNVFWVVSLGVIAVYLFFFAFGAFTFDDVLPLSITVAVLTAMWFLHAGRERRGF